MENTRCCSVIFILWVNFYGNRNNELLTLEKQLIIFNSILYFKILNSKEFLDEIKIWATRYIIWDYIIMQ